MTGAIAVGSGAFALAGRLKKSYLGALMTLPSSRVIDKRLVLGSLAFGVGWGMAGICPVRLGSWPGTGSAKGIVFVMAMLLGMGIFEILQRRRQKVLHDRQGTVQDH